MESKGRVFQWKGMEQKPCSQHQEPSPPDELHRRSGGAVGSLRSHRHLPIVRVQCGPHGAHEAPNV